MQLQKKIQCKWILSLPEAQKKRPKEVEVKTQPQTKEDKVLAKRKSNSESITKGLSTNRE